MARVTFRLLDTGPGSPAENMAVDEVLLAGAEARPTLRLYAWDPPGFSLGYFQALDDAPETDLPVVRRLTGGGAILHEDELTYAVAAPLAFFGAGVKGSYLRVLGGIRAALAEVGVACDEGDAGARGAAPLQSRGTGGNLGTENDVTENDVADGVGARCSAPLQAGNDGKNASFLCSHRASSFDLRHRGEKLVGSAQRREGRRILQHGSIPLEPLARAAGRRVPYDELARAIAAGFGEALAVDLEPAPLERAEHAAARALAADRYAAPSWTGLR